MVLNDCTDSQTSNSTAAEGAHNSCVPGSHNSAIFDNWLCALLFPCSLVKSIRMLTNGKCFIIILKQVFEKVKEEQLLFSLKLPLSLFSVLLDWKVTVLLGFILLREVILITGLI